MVYVYPTVASAVSNAQWVGDQWNFGAMWIDIQTLYGSVFGQGQFGISFMACSILMIIVGAVWYRQENIAIPSAIVSIVSISSLFAGVIPLEVQLPFMVFFGALPVAGVFYSLYKSSR